MIRSAKSSVAAKMLIHMTKNILESLLLLHFLQQESPRLQDFFAVVRTALLDLVDVFFFACAIIFPFIILMYIVA